MKTYCILLTFLIGYTRAHTYGFGSCEKIKAMPHFNWEKFKGVWFIQESFSGGKCMAETYRGMGDKKEVKQEEDTIIGKINDFGALETPFANDPGEMSVKFSRSYSGKASWVVVDTDYESYASIWSCSNLIFAHRANAEILSRDMGIKQMSGIKARASLEEKGIDVSKLKPVVQSAMKCDSPVYDDYLKLELPEGMEDQMYGFDEINGRY